MAIAVFAASFVGATDAGGDELAIIPVTVHILSDDKDAAAEPDEVDHIIAPYFKSETWMFDDEKKGLVEEPFVFGMPEIIDKMTSDIPNAREGFRLLFSAEPFPEYELKATRAKPESGRYWYTIEGTGQEGWLCPALLRYYATAPETLYDLRVDPDERISVAYHGPYTGLAAFFRKKLGSIVLGDGRVECDWTQRDKYTLSDLKARTRGGCRGH